MNLANTNQQKQQESETIASSEQADAQSRPQVKRQMLPIHCHAWTCLSIVKLECISFAKRLPLKTVNENKFFSSESLTFILTKNQSDYSMVCKNPKSFLSQPLSTLCLEECRRLSFLAAFLTLFLANVLTNYFN